MAHLSLVLGEVGLLPAVSAAAQNVSREDRLSLPSSGRLEFC
jgi:hypothetical protein